MEQTTEASIRGWRRELGNDEPAVLESIKELVQRFRVCWEVYPEQALTEKDVRKIGFSLELYGTPEETSEGGSAVFSRNEAVALALRQIASWILPQEKRPSWYELDVESQSVSYSRQRGERPDVRATIRILHRNNWDQPIDECELRCLNEMERALNELGACQGAWRAART